MRKLASPPPRALDPALLHEDILKRLSRSRLLVVCTVLFGLRCLTTPLCRRARKKTLKDACHRQRHTSERWRELNGHVRKLCRSRPRCAGTWACRLHRLVWCACYNYKLSCRAHMLHTTRQLQTPETAKPREVRPSGGRAACRQTLKARGHKHCTHNIHTHQCATTIHARKTRTHERKPLTLTAHHPAAQPESQGESAWVT